MNPHPQSAYSCSYRRMFFNAVYIHAICPNLDILCVLFLFDRSNQITSTRPLRHELIKMLGTLLAHELSVGYMHEGLPKAEVALKKSIAIDPHLWHFKHVVEAR